MQRKYQQFPVWTGHLVKTTRLLNHTNNGKDCHRYSGISSDCRNKMKACDPANILIYYLSFAPGISLKNIIILSPIVLSRLYLSWNRSKR